MSWKRRESSRMRNTRPFIILVIAACLIPDAGAGNIYVSPGGNNSDPGTPTAPVRTLGYALGLVGPGDTIFMMTGRYHEEISINNLKGTEEAPIVITALNGNQVTLDGTVPIESDWTLYSGNIYKTALNQDIWQLFVDEAMMMPARWPNAFLEDQSVWDREHNWGHGNEGPAENGVFVDSPHGSVSLAASGIDANGAIAVMNIGSWKTWSRDVLSHDAGSNTFTYSPVPAYKDKHHYYFLEGKLELLDAPGEWFYDKNTKELYLWLPDGTMPGSGLRGKVQSFVLHMEKCSHIKIEGLGFFATTFYYKNCTHMTVEDCDLRFPSCSKRVLGDHSTPDVTTMFNANTYNPTRNALINCSISFTESQAISFKGHTNRVENCGFYAIDWTVANRPGLMNSIYNEGNSNVFRRNSVELTGASSTLYPGNFPIVELNRITRTGFLQSDGSITQLTIGAQPNSQTRYNWFHNTVKSGARFDAPIPPTVWGNGGTMHHNMVWETNIGLMQKGEYHFCFHNTALQCAKNGMVILDDAAEGGGGNKGTITRNNFSDKLSGHRDIYVKVPGEADHNWNGYETGADFRGQVYDFLNHDFRPRWNSALVDAGVPIDQLEEPYIGIAPDLGAYEFGDSVYWIGGRQLERASTPIPGDQGTTSYEFVDLMWLQAYQSLSSEVYFGTSEAAVASADQNSPEYRGIQIHNIFSPGALQAGQSYFWRIDAVKEGAIVKGEVWSFTAGVDANPPVHSATFRVYGIRDGVVTPLDSAMIRLGERKSRTGPDGRANITMLPEGMYHYQVSQKGYTPVTDSLYILSDTLIQDTLDHVTYHLTFVLKDADSGEPIGGGEILCNDQVLITDAEGVASLSDMDYGWYEIASSAAGFLPLENLTVEVFSDTTLELILMKEYLQVSVRIIDRAERTPVYRARISYGDQLKLTNSSGEVNLDKIPVGYWSYSVEHEDYFLLTDSLLIRADTTLEFELTSVLAQIQFQISDIEGPVEGVLVTLDGFLSLVTGSDGLVQFFNKPARQDHAYLIEKEGYETVSDTLFLEMDTLVSVMLQKPSGIGDHGSLDPRIFPNPVSGTLFIENADPQSIFLITGPDGKIVLNGKCDQPRKRIDLSGFAPGIYGVQIRSKDDLWNTKIVIH